MQIIEDVENNRDLVEKAIKQFGFAPEHNFDWFLDYANHDQTPIIVSWDDELILAYKDDDMWYTFSEPLTQENHRGQRVIELTDFICKNFPKVKKVVVEAREDTRQQIIDQVTSDLKIVGYTNEDYELIWPIMNMQKFDPTLAGGHFKSIRNAKSKFYRDHKVEIKNVSEVAIQDLKGVVDRWLPIVKDREGEFTHEEPYYNIIKTGFQGTAVARAMIVDGQVVGFNSGWEIPNSEIFYAAIGIHDYSIPDLGLMLYLEDLEWIKSAGYNTADMGGVEEGSPLKFKNQFLPESWYKTFVFHITKNE